MSFSSSDDDSQQRFALGFLFALIALVIAVVVGSVVVNRLQQAPMAPATAVASNAAAAGGADMVAVDVASVRVQDGVVTFYFVSAKADLAEGANAALASVVQGAAQGQKAVVSGFHDDSGNAALNAELAQQRAVVVRDALKALGVADDRIELKKPEQTAGGSANDALARRVEVVLVPI